jgi:hypothetical protein
MHQARCGKVGNMKFIWLPLLAFASTCLCQNSDLPAASGRLANALKSATFPLAVTAKGELGDAGGKLMIDAIEHAQFVLLGESHFSRETPKLAAAVCRVMHPDSYAVEAGPYAAAYVNGLLNNPGRAFQMQTRERTHPANMAFLSDEQENDLAASCSASTVNKNFALWGLDQEFLGAASVLLMQMAAQSNGPKTVAAIRLAEAKDKQAELKARSSGDATQLFLDSASDSDIFTLQAALASDGTPTSQAIMHEFTESRRIYRLNSAGSPESNSVRSSLLKQHFLDHYRTLERTTTAPRILLKFGDNHMWKGFNGLHQLDLGDFVAELASVDHTTSLHIQVLAAKGTLADFGGYARPMKNESFVLSDIPEYHWLKPVVDMIPAPNGVEPEGVVVDLRKLRFRNLELPNEWENLIYGYDLLVMLPEFTPANLYQ